MQHEDQHEVRTNTTKPTMFVGWCRCLHCGAWHALSYDRDEIAAFTNLVQRAPSDAMGKIVLACGAYPPGHVLHRHGKNAPSNGDARASEEANALRDEPVPSYGVQLHNNGASQT